MAVGAVYTKIKADRDERNRLIYKYSRYDEQNPNFREQGEIILPAEQVLHIPGLGIRLIYRSFMEGLTTNKIAQMLMAQEVPAPGGQKKWYSRTIESILTNTP